MAPHSGTLAWKIPGTGEPGGLPSMGSRKYRYKIDNKYQKAKIKNLE